MGDAASGCGMTFCLDSNSQSTTPTLCHKWTNFFGVERGSRGESKNPDSARSPETGLVYTYDKMTAIHCL